MLFPLTVGMTVTLVAGFQWLQHLGVLSANPWIYTVAAILVLGWSVLKIRRAWPRLRASTQGLRGERAVADSLSNLRTHGYRAFHDIPVSEFGSSWNIDHVLVGPSGIYAIETKTWSKPRGQKMLRRQDEVSKDGGKNWDGRPAEQSKRNAAWLGKRLSEMTGRRGIQVRPVVVFPGWWVDERSGTKVWILNPERLSAWLNSEASRDDVRLSTSDQAMFCERLALLARE